MPVALQTSHTLRRTACGELHALQQFVMQETHPNVSSGRFNPIHHLRWEWKMKVSATNPSAPGGQWSGVDVTLGVCSSHASLPISVSLSAGNQSCSVFSEKISLLLGESGIQFCQSNRLKPNNRAAHQAFAGLTELAWSSACYAFQKTLAFFAKAAGFVFSISAGHGLLCMITQQQALSVDGVQLLDFHIHIQW